MGHFIQILAALHKGEAEIPAARQCQASIVILGTADEFGMEPRYEIVRNKDVIEVLPDLDIFILTELSIFSAYAVYGTPRI